jgi:hypothetical protein
MRAMGWREIPLLSFSYTHTPALNILVALHHPFHLSFPSSQPLSFAVTISFSNEMDSTYSPPLVISISLYSFPHQVCLHPPPPTLPCSSSPLFHVLLFHLGLLYNLSHPHIAHIIIIKLQASRQY